MASTVSRSAMISLNCSTDSCSLSMTSFLASSRGSLNASLSAAPDLTASILFSRLLTDRLILSFMVSMLSLTVPMLSLSRLSAVSLVSASLVRQLCSLVCAFSRLLACVVRFLTLESIDAIKSSAVACASLTPEHAASMFETLHFRLATLSLISAAALLAS